MKRLRKILKWIGIVAGAAIAILLMLNAYFVWSTGTQLESRLVALRQAGDPVQLADLAHEPIPPEKNADVFLRLRGRRPGRDPERTTGDLSQGRVSPGVGVAGRPR